MKAMRLTRLRAGDTADGVVRGLRDDQIVWDVCRRYRAWFRKSPDLEPAQRFFSPRGQVGTPAQALSPFDPLDEFQDTHDLPNPARHQPFPSAALAPALLAALEDPARWVAAHVLLTRLYRATTDDRDDGDPRHGGGRSGLRPVGDGTWDLTYDGLHVGLRRAGPDYDWTDDDSDGAYWRVTPCVGTADAAQLPAIRDRWHRRLDVPIWSSSHAPLAVGTAVLPVSWFAVAAGRRVRAAARRRRCCCPSCGYDLRATPARCPECGTVTSR